jgi:peptide/nickel transport system permease protein
MDENRLEDFPATTPVGLRRRIPSILIVGAIIVSFILVAAIAAPAIAPYPYDEFHITDRFQPPNSTYWFGTDEFGRDVFSRVLMGARLSLFMGIFATVVSLTLGVPLGLIAGYYRGRLGELIMRTMDLFMSFPPIILGLLILAVTPPNILKTAAAVGIVYVPAIVRVTRSVTLDLIGEEFILAARARGERDLYIVGAEILPNAWPPIIVEGSLRITFAILLGAALSFLGMGAQPPSSDWGLMISEARSFLDFAPWIAIAPGVVMCIALIGVNLAGDGLRELLDPRLRHKERI